jgi:hypothetical protein
MEEGLEKGGLAEKVEMVRAMLVEAISFIVKVPESSIEEIEQIRDEYNGDFI